MAPPGSTAGSSSVTTCERGEHPDADAWADGGQRDESGAGGQCAAARAGRDEGEADEHQRAEAPPAERGAACAERERGDRGKRQLVRQGVRVGRVRPVVDHGACQAEAAVLCARILYQDDDGQDGGREQQDVEPACDPGPIVEARWRP